jgi:transitional endoplasmic reticulum ATPase
LKNWIEEKLLYVLIFSAMTWPPIMLIKMVGRSPLTFHWYPSMNWETWPVGIAIAVLAILLLISFCEWILARDENFGGADLLEYLGPRICLSGLLVLLLWWSDPPSDGTAVPLVAMIVVSGWSFYLARWGFLRRRISAAVPERGRIVHAEARLDEPARLTSARITFAHIHGNDALKSRLRDAGAAIIAEQRKSAAPRNGILLHGAPGNGKTMFVEALAGELGVPLVTLAYADVASQWVGERSARVKQAFEQAIRHQPCILFIDEVDSFLDSRVDHADAGVKEDRDLVNAMLTLMVEIRRARVIVVAATNHVDRLDAAGTREGRFDFKVEITPPDHEARIGLLRHGLQKHLPKVKVADDTLRLVAKRWNGFSVKRIMAVTEELPHYVHHRGNPELCFEDFMGALRQLQGQRGLIPENVKPLRDLVLSEATREMIAQIVGRMADPEHTEQHGGTLPTGVLFYGPPGTGKTATCKALANELQWAFLTATGAELASDAGSLEKLYSKAKDLRPSIIFIDEADELLRSREYGGNTSATNKLLTLMDGISDRVADVVWIAATNHPDQIDPALVRGGRFTEKVPFGLPGREGLVKYLQDWFSARKVGFSADLQISEVVDLIGSNSIANAESIAQAALNKAISRRGTPVIVSRGDLEHGARVVNGVVC